MMSTGSTADHSIFVMSPWFGTFGQCAARTLDGAASNSQNHLVSASKNCSTAQSKPPYPLHSEPMVSRVMRCSCAAFVAVRRV